MSSIKEKIRQEIERLYDGEAPKHDQQCEFGDGYFQGLSTILNFIDSLPNEDTTEDLNELIQKWDRIDINTVLKVKVKATGKIIDGFYDGRGHFDHFVDHDVFDRYSIDEVELMSDEEPSNDLEEATEKYLDTLEVAPLFCGSYEAWQVSDALKAGAEWQRKQDEHLIWRIAEKNFEGGKEAMKEQMMKDIRLAYGKVSMNPFELSEAFEELINKYKQV